MAFIKTGMVVRKRYKLNSFQDLMKIGMYYSIVDETNLSHKSIKQALPNTAS